MGPESFLQWWRERGQRVEILAVAALVIYWLVLIRGAIGAYFGVDDLMNLYGAWGKSWPRLSLDIAQFWRSQERPFGQLAYRVVYALFGFNHVPFRAMHIGLLAVNLVLQYLLARKLSGSRLVAAFTIFCGGFHSFLWFLYASTGTIYDVLCGTAFYLAFWLYAGKKQVSPARTAALIVLAILAIDAKEMGVTLGASMLLWEVMVARRRVAWPLLLVNLVSVAGIAGRLLLPGPLSKINAYRPVFTLARISETAASYTNLLLAPYFRLTIVGVLVLWLVVAAAAFFISRRAFWGVLFFWLNLSPLLVAPPRDTGYVLYVPLFGLAFALGSALGVLRSKLDAAPRWQWIATGVCFAAVFLLHGAEYRQTKDYLLPLAAEIREVADQVPQMMPAPRSKVAILMLNSPLDTTSAWEAMYILSLKYGRRDVSVKMRRWDPVTTPLKVNPEEYQYVFQYDRFLHKYSKITRAAYAGIDRLPPPARAAMGSSEAELCIVNDVGPASDGVARWGHQNPEFRFAAGPGGATRFFLDVFVPEVFVREAGPQRVQLFLNGEAGGMQTIHGTGDFRVTFDLPRGLSPGEPARIRLQVANPWVAKEDGTRLSFLIWAAGLE